MELFYGYQVVVPKGRQEHLDARPALNITGKKVICQRCQTKSEKKAVCLADGSYYCGGCLSFGRLTSKDVLISGRRRPHLMAKHDLVWSGTYTKWQAEIAIQLCTNYLAGKNSLLWAVTGSGKTEMLFLVIEKALAQGKLLALVAPRIDVCLELYPRLQAAFPSLDILLLYGQSKESFRESQLIICTSHQLLHFYQRFDLLIFDEIDAFPYQGDPRLAFALSQAVTPVAQKIFLTATMSPSLLKQLDWQCEVLQLPIRFHQRPLIVPEFSWFNNWVGCFTKQRPFKKLVAIIEQLLQDNDVLIFCSNILQMEQLAKKLQMQANQAVLTSVSSKDEQRTAKIKAMRQGKYRILLTTMILERGVTFANISVIVLGANHSIYTKSSLIQIAGRVDRQEVFHHGRVLFLYDQQTSAMRQAKREIQVLNAAAKELADEM
ncbi:MAG: DEAD/DEAH box helicase [Enterococcus sp.]